VKKWTVLSCALLLVPALLAAPVFCQTAVENVTIVASPSTINLDSQGEWVTIHADIAYSLVAGISVTLNGIAVDFTKADNRGELVAKFAVDGVKDIVEPGTAELTLFGLTKLGTPFTGSDTVRVVDVSGKRR